MFNLTGKQEKIKKKYRVSTLQIQRESYKSQIDKERDINFNYTKEKTRERWGEGGRENIIFLTLIINRCNFAYLVGHKDKQAQMNRCQELTFSQEHLKLNPRCSKNGV